MLRFSLILIALILFLCGLDVLHCYLDFNSDHSALKVGSNLDDYNLILPEKYNECEGEKLEIQSGKAVVIGYYNDIEYRYRPLFFRAFFVRFLNVITDLDGNIESIYVRRRPVMSAFERD
jgi:hypothetical protein